jgi:hypothetical protein
MELSFGAVMSLAKRNSGCLIGLVFVLVLAASTGCGSGGEAQEDQISLDTFFSGSGTDSLIDTDGNGANALIVWANGAVASLGHINFSEIIETSMVEPAVPCATSEGVPGNVYELVRGRIALQVQETGDIITGSFISNDQCIPVGFAEGDAVEFEGQWMVTGGTGRFVNASGTVNFSGSARLLLSHVSGRFIIATARHSGIIELH